MAVPFQLGFFACFSAGVLSIPLVFHLPTVEYFDEHFVTAEHPPTKELETSLEVGAWSWNWVEPVLVTSTFLLLSLQYMRYVICFVLLAVLVLERIVPGSNRKTHLIFTAYVMQFIIMLVFTCNIWVLLPTHTT